MMRYILLNNLPVFINLAKLAFGLESSLLDDTDTQKNLQRGIRKALAIQQELEEDSSCNCDTFFKICDRYCKAPSEKQEIIARYKDVEKILGEIGDLIKYHATDDLFCRYLREAQEFGESVKAKLENQRNGFQELQDQNNEEEISTDNPSNHPPENGQDGQGYNQTPLTQSDQTSSKPEARACSAGNQK